MRGYGGADKGAVREQPAARALSRRWGIEEAIERMARVLEWGVEDLCCRGGGIERGIVMECLHRYTQVSQKEIGSLKWGYMPSGVGGDERLAEGLWL